MVWVASCKFQVTHYVLKENTRLNSYFKILTQNLKNMNLVFYLKTISENVDLNVKITFPKTDLSLDV